jgi:SNF2 family DNA or RNA helicase
MDVGPLAYFYTGMTTDLRTNDRDNELVFEGFRFSTLSPAFIFENSTGLPDTGSARFFGVYPDMIDINVGAFSNPGGTITFPAVAVNYKGDTLRLSCACKSPGEKLCEHQAQVLYNIMQREDLRIFFDKTLRHERIKDVAKNYGLENEPDPDAHFELTWINKTARISPRLKNLQPVNKETLRQMEGDLIGSGSTPPLREKPIAILVFSAHKFYKHLQVGLYETVVTAGGKLKKVLGQLDPLEQAWQSNDAAMVKFCTGIAAFANNHEKTPTAHGLKALQAIMKNPEGISAFVHDPERSENVVPSSLVPMELALVNSGLQLHVFLKAPYYEVSGQLSLGEKIYPLEVLQVRNLYFIQSGSTLYLVNNLELLRVFSYFKKHNNIVLVHENKFDEFRKTILAKLEDTIQISYAWLVAATKQQLEENGFDVPLEKIIYLSDAGQYVTISPVIRYGEVEVSVLSKRQLFALDQQGKAFIVERDEGEELALTALLLKQHPQFEEQLHQEAFHLTKTDFLDKGWYLDAIEEWRKHGIKVLGFQEIDRKRLNTYKPSVTVTVTSGLDWFETNLDVRYGKQKASLRQLHKSLKNGSKYVTLDDGTLGMLPAAWVERMKTYFEAGIVHEEIIRTPKVNFSTIETVYDAEMLSGEVQGQLEIYREKLRNFETIEAIGTPAGFTGSLRPYQQQGVSWLNFLDDFGFGGCLADDMGLGKTIQVIAFILHLQQKRGRNTHLVVVPASLIFNWEAELEKFAPGLKLLTLHGNKRVKSSRDFDTYDIVLTSYGMLQPTMHFLKGFRFWYIFLDESQAIKNPDSQRHNLVCMLQAANRIVLTGTPIENNSLDLYGQLSFACPGLLGTPRYFRDVYLQPIDKFGDSKRAAALQQKISPFILRRTKKQVATELPEKTEMIIYCEMGMEQRKVYDAYEREFRNYLLHQPEEDLPRNSMNVLQGLTKLRQICNSPALLKDQTFFGDASAKIEVLVEQIESKYRQHKILVFSQFVSMLNLVRKELSARYIPHEYLTGQTVNREAVVNSFRENEEIRVFLVSLKAGGTGLNLTEADYVYLVDPWWNPAVENQAIDRCYRIGQEKHVVAVRLICPGTIEEKIMQLQATKTSRVNDLIKTDQGMIRQFNKEDLLKLVSGENRSANGDE